MRSPIMSWWSRTSESRTAKPPRSCSRTGISMRPATRRPSASRRSMTRPSRSDLEVHASVRAGPRRPESAPSRRPRRRLDSARRTAGSATGIRLPGDEKVLRRLERRRRTRRASRSGAATPRRQRRKLDPRLALRVVRRASPCAFSAPSGQPCRTLRRSTSAAQRGRSRSPGVAIPTPSPTAGRRAPPAGAASSPAARCATSRHDPVPARGDAVEIRARDGDARRSSLAQESARPSATSPRSPAKPEAERPRRPSASRRPRP